MLTKHVAIVLWMTLLLWIVTASSSPGPHTRKQRLTKAIEDAHNGVDNDDLNINQQKFSQYMREDTTTEQQREHIPWHQGEFPGRDLEKLPDNSLCTTDNLTGCRMHKSGNKLHHVDVKVEAREFYNPNNHDKQPGVPQSLASGGILQREGKDQWKDLAKFTPNIRQNLYGNGDGTGEAIFAMHKKNGEWRGAYRDTKTGSKWKPFLTGPVDIPAQESSAYEAQVKKLEPGYAKWVPFAQREQNKKLDADKNRSKSREKVEPRGSPR
jgi:hypothetical protein